MLLPCSAPIQKTAGKSSRRFLLFRCSVLPLLSQRPNLRCQLGIVLVCSSLSALDQLKQGLSRRPADSQPLISPQCGHKHLQAELPLSWTPWAQVTASCGGEGGCGGKAAASPEQPSATHSHLALPAQLWPGVQVPALHVCPPPVLPAGGASSCLLHLPAHSFVIPGPAVPVPTLASTAAGPSP